jgi:S1-C subfamily serine protease
MNYFFLIVILLVCGGAYYENTVQQQKVTEYEQKLSDQDAKITSLQGDNKKLTDVKSALTASLAEAQSKVKDLSQAPKPAAPVASTLPVTGTPVVGATSAAPSAPASAAPAPTKLNGDQMSRAVVVIKGDNAEGTGFLVKTADGPVVVTNLHVLANNPNIKILTYNGVPITPTGLKGAPDRDLAMLTIQDGAYTYLPLATDIGNTAKVGDEVITPGNSQGGDVVLSTKGRLLALGPDRVEFDNPIYHGNSGGPVFHTASGTVLGVVTEAMKVDVSNDLDKTSFQSRNSAIASSMRYFGLRLDTVAKWETYDPKRFQNETAFLDQFNKQSRCLDSYLNPPKQPGNNMGGQSANPSSTNGADAKLYLTDEKIMAAHHSFRQQLAGADTAGQIDALRQLGFGLDSIADKNMEAIRNMDNFYTFDQQRARDELAYRKALKTEIQEFSNDVTRIGSLPRTSN